MKTWIGLDSALTAFGYAVLRDSEHSREVLTIGCWKTVADSRLGKFADTARRVQVLGENLHDLIQQHRPDAVFIEGLAFVPGNSFMTGSILGRVRGVTEGICICERVPMYEFTAQAIKRFLCDDVRAEKSAVATAVRKLYPTNAVRCCVDENATDALAVAHVGSFHPAVAGEQ